MSLGAPELEALVGRSFDDEMIGHLMIEDAGLDAARDGVGSLVRQATVALERLAESDPDSGYYGRPAWLAALGTVLRELDTQRRRLAFLDAVAAGESHPWYPGTPESLDAMAMRLIGQRFGVNSIGIATSAATQRISLDVGAMETIRRRVQFNVRTLMNGQRVTPGERTWPRDEIERLVQDDLERLRRLQRRVERLNTAIEELPSILAAELSRLVDDFGGGTQAIVRALALESSSDRAAIPDATLTQLVSEWQQADTRFGNTLAVLETSNPSDEEVAVLRADIYGNIEDRLNARRAELKNEAAEVYRCASDVVAFALQGDVDCLSALAASASRNSNFFPAGFTDRLKDAIAESLARAGNGGFVDALVVKRLDPSSPLPPL